MCPRFQTEMIMLHWKKEKWRICLMWQNSTQLNSKRLILESEYLLTFKAVSFIGPQNTVAYGKILRKFKWCIPMGFKSDGFFNLLGVLLAHTYSRRTIFELPDTKVYWLSADLISCWITRFTVLLVTVMTCMLPWLPGHKWN